MKKIYVLLMFVFIINISWSQKLYDHAQKVYIEGIPQIVSLQAGDSLLNVKIGPDHQIWTTINYKDGTQRATEIVRVDFEWKVSPRKKDDFTLIAGINGSGHEFLSVGFPDGRKIYRGDKKIIRSNYPQRDLVEIYTNNYLVSILKGNFYQIYRYQDNITRYPEPIEWDSLKNMDLVNLSYFDGEMTLDTYTNGQYQSYLSMKNNGNWSDPQPLKIRFLQGCHSINIQDSLVVGIRDNQLYIWEIVPDSWWIWEELEDVTQMNSSRADTATSQIVLFFWNEGDAEPNLMNLEMFKKLNLSVDSNSVIKQTPQEVIDLIGNSYDVTINTKGYMFNSETFDLIDNPQAISTVVTDSVCNDGSSQILSLIGEADEIIIQVGAYGPTYYMKHFKQGGFRNMIGGRYIIWENWNNDKSLVRYQINLSGMSHKQKVLDALLDYTDRLAQLSPPDIPFLILRSNDGSEEWYYYEEETNNYKQINKGKKEIY